MQINSFAQFVGYLESLAEQHKDIKHNRQNVSHFTRLDTDELDNEIQNKVGFPVICLDRYSASLSGESGNVTKKKGITIMILDHVPDQTDFDHIHEVWDKTEAIGDDFIAKIFDDMSKLVINGIFDLDLSSVAMEPASNKSIGLYGTIITFNLNTKFCLKPPAGAFS